MSCDAQYLNERLVRVTDRLHHAGDSEAVDVIKELVRENVFKDDRYQTVMQVLFFPSDN